MIISLVQCTYDYDKMLEIYQIQRIRRLFASFTYMTPVTERYISETRMAITLLSYATLF